MSGYPVWSRNIISFLSSFWLSKGVFIPRIIFLGVHILTMQSRIWHINEWKVFIYFCLPFLLDGWVLFEFFFAVHHCVLTKICLLNSTSEIEVSSLFRTSLWGSKFLTTAWWAGVSELLFSSSWFIFLYKITIENYIIVSK